MNPNDILAQQQALLNQLAHNSQQVMWGILVIQLALLILTAWVIYMFYARLRDIAHELRLLRETYAASIERMAPPASSAHIQDSRSDESRYMPKP